MTFPAWSLRFSLIRFVCRALSDICFLIFVYIWPYRREVITKNLKNAFPDHSQKENNQLLRACYRHLADLITEPVLMRLCRKRDLSRMVRYENVSLLRELLAKGSDVVLMASHCGNWEYLFSLPLIIDAEVLAVYSPVSPGFLNDALKKLRSRFGISLIPKKEWYRKTLQHTSEKPAVYISVSDQRPARPGNQTVRFMNQTTHVQSGAVRIAGRRAAAVVYLDVKKEKRNSYHFRFELLAENASECCESQIITAYYQHLEKTILRKPELWLWSHNRWKF